MVKLKDDTGRRFKGRNVEAVLASKILTHRWYLISLENWHARLVEYLFKQARTETVGILKQMWPNASRGTRGQYKSVRSELSRIAPVLYSAQYSAYMTSSAQAQDVLRDRIEEQMFYEHKWYFTLLFKNIPRLTEAAAPPKTMEWWTAVERSGMYDPLNVYEARRRVRGFIPDGTFNYLSNWKHRLLRRQLSLGLSQGWGIEKIASKINKVLKKGEASAMRIARTETLRVSNQLARQTYDGNKNVVAGVQNFATLDRKTCLICGDLDRRTYWYDKDPRVSLAPTYPIHPNCRCFQAPVSRLWERVGTDPPWTARESEFGPVSYEDDWNDWMDNMEHDNPGFAIDNLGPTRYGLWKSGEPLSRFVDRNKILTLDQLKVRGVSIL